MDLKTTFEKLPAGHITGIAGVPYRDGIPAKEAHVGWPIGVVRRDDGDLIVADWQANRFWRIDQDGILHAFAGGSVPGNSGDGGPAIEARFRGPHSLYLDSQGNYYTADLANNTIRRIDARTSVVTTVAGSGRTGHGGDGGPALEAEFDVHCGMAVDEDGNLFVSSEWQNTIRKIDAKTGIIDHFAGHDGRHYPSERENSKPYVGKGLEDWGGLTWGGYHGDGGPASEASFFHPEHLAFDSKGDLYVCDNSNHRIRKIDMATGIITTVLGNGMPASNGDGGPAAEASTLMPDAICLDVHDNLFVGEKWLPRSQGRCRKWDSHDPGRQRRAGMGRRGTAWLRHHLQLRRGRYLRRPGRHRSLVRLLGTGAPLRWRDGHRDYRAGRYQYSRW